MILYAYTFVYNDFWLLQNYMDYKSFFFDKIADYNVNLKDGVMENKQRLSYTLLNIFLKYSLHMITVLSSQGNVRQADSRTVLKEP